MITSIFTECLQWRALVGPIHTGKIIQGMGMLKQARLTTALFWRYTECKKHQNVSLILFKDLYRVN